MQLFDTLKTSLYELSLYTLNPGQRIYFWYLLGAILLAALVFITRYKRRSFKKFFRFLFPKKVWLAQSAKQDYIILVVNKLIRGLILVPFLILSAPIALSTDSFLEWLLGSIDPISETKWIIMTSFTLLLFILDDLSRFILHYCLHKIPFLWEIHKVHHSAKVLTPITIYRSHPIENYLFASRLAIAQGLSMGIALYLFGMTKSISLMELAGASIFVFAFNFMGSNLRHSHIWISWGNKLEGWLISPAQHQIHHSDNPKHFDHNMGSALAIWDRMAGTLIKAHQVDRINFGVGRNFNQHDSVINIYWLPLKASFYKLLVMFRLAKPS
jgi:sterol desaturase/sphingolipid hydroxylase (fatty acid hydroxylase superfamily)